MHKILIVYASGYGSTAGVAEAIGKYLAMDDATVTVSQVSDIENIENYDAVIVGSAIRFDRWMPAARTLVLNNKDILEKIPVAYFFNCLTLAQRNDETEKKANHYAEQLYALNKQVKPLSIGRFSGVLDYTKMPFFLKLVFKIFAAIVGLKEGDYRDWKKIQQWTKDVEVQFNEALKQS